MEKKVLPVSWWITNLFASSYRPQDGTAALTRIPTVPPELTPGHGAYAVIATNQTDSEDSYD